MTWQKAWECANYICYQHRRRGYGGEPEYIARNPELL